METQSSFLTPSYLLWRSLLPYARRINKWVKIFLWLVRKHLSLVSLDCLTFWILLFFKISQKGLLTSGYSLHFKNKLHLEITIPFSNISKLLFNSDYQDFSSCLWASGFVSAWCWAALSRAFTLGLLFLWQQPEFLHLSYWHLKAQLGSHHRASLWSLSYSG